MRQVIFRKQACLEFDEAGDVAGCLYLIAMPTPLVLVRSVNRGLSMDVPALLN